VCVCVCVCVRVVSIFALNKERPKERKRTKYDK